MTNVCTLEETTNDHRQPTTIYLFTIYLQELKDFSKYL